MWDPNLQERCFVFHGPVLYEATIKFVHRANVDVIDSKKQGELSIKEMLADKKLILDVPESLFAKESYYIHYKGWPKAWDEWVDPVRVLPYTPENIRKMKELKKHALDLASHEGEVRRVEIAVQGENLSGGAGGVATSSTSAQGSSGSINGQHVHGSGRGSSTIPVSTTSARMFPGRLSDDESFFKVQRFLVHPPFNIDIPKLLRSKIVEDWDNIKVNKKLVRLPSAVPISEIFAIYKSHYGSIVSLSHKNNGGSNNGSERAGLVSNINRINDKGSNNGTSYGESGEKTSGRKKSHHGNNNSNYVIYGEFLEEFLTSVKIFFNRSLNKLVLYNFEKLQAQQLQQQLIQEANEGKDEQQQQQQRRQQQKQRQQNVDIYGVQHLLRLLAILPDLICQYDIDTQAQDIAKFFIQDIYRFLDQRQDLWMSEWEYFDAPSIYIEKVEEAEKEKATGT